MIAAGARTMAETEPIATWVGRVWRMLIGPPRDLYDRRLFHKLALIPILAWVGLGADGLSSSAYGPEEAFRALGDHVYLALPLALAMATTVAVLCTCYSRIIEHFPQGGGGYVVATALLGRRAGVVAGGALLVDYVLTITVSVAAAGMALFSFLPASWYPARMVVEIGLILGLMTVNIRGVRESVLLLTPLFALFAVTHLMAIVGGVIEQGPYLATTAQRTAEGFRSGFSSLGLWGLLLVFFHGYSLGGGTYTGIEAVSNGLPIMREPRVQTGKRTMLYMAVSLAVVASGILVCYLLWRVEPVPGETMNATLLRQISANWWGGQAFVVLALLSEGALLVVAAQTGFLGGPRVLAYMATDSWVPRQFAALSERLTTQNGIVLMGAASLAALIYTRGNVSQLVVMYSINVFVTFSLSMLGMTRWALRAPKHEKRPSDLPLFAGALVMCLTILGITIYEKFDAGGWLTLVVTGLLIAGCLLVNRHYAYVTRRIREVESQLAKGLPKCVSEPLPMDKTQPTAAILVAGYSGLGVHTVLSVFRTFPGYFKNLVFLSVGVIDSGEFKGEKAVEGLRARTAESLEKYVQLGCSLGIPSTSYMAVGPDVVDEAEALCLKVAKEFERVTFFGGKVVFKRERWYERILHNQTATALQRRLHWAGATMVILPIRFQA